MTFRSGCDHVTPECDTNLMDIPSIVVFEAPSSSLADTCQWRGKETILLVEDAALVRKAAAEALQSAGYQVFIADNADHALETYRESCTPVDLLLTDVVMAGISGPELAQTLFLLCPDVRIMLMSGYAEELLAGELSPYRTEYLAKPFSASTLLQRVRQVLDKRPQDFAAPA